MTRPGDLGANLIGPETPILEAVAQMDAARRKLLLVVDDERRLLGALTDGDIRRGLMRRLPMEAPVHEVMKACAWPKFRSFCTTSDTGSASKKFGRMSPGL